MPSYSTATAMTISLVLQPSADNGGAKVSLYELYIDDGNSGVYSKIASYHSTMAFVID